jgi:hypothetical protein
MRDIAYYGKCNCSASTYRDIRRTNNIRKIKQIFYENKEELKCLKKTILSY